MDFWHSVQLRVEHVGHRTGLADPQNKSQPWRAITISPWCDWKGVIFCTPAEVLTLATPAARFLLRQPDAPTFKLSDPYYEYTFWYTREASSYDLPPNVLDRRGTPWEGGPSESPRVADLFDSHDFWSLLQELRSNRSDRPTARRLAAFVRERGFDHLAKLLRSDTRAARRLLPAGRLATREFFPVSARETTSDPVH